MTGKSKPDRGPFGFLLYSCRTAANLTQEELAERSGLSVNAITKLERGVRRAPRPSTVESLAEALQLSAQQRQALVLAARGSGEGPAPREPGVTHPVSAEVGKAPRDVPLSTPATAPLDEVESVQSQAEGTRRPFSERGGSFPRRRGITYPPEVRAEAIRLAQAGSRSIRAVARDLGVSDRALRHWLKRADHDSGRPGDGLTDEERRELIRLRRENRRLREEREPPAQTAAEQD